MKYLKYLKYLIKHKWYVMIACFKFGLFWRGIIHDISKNSWHEFTQYAKWFYGGKDMDEKNKIKLEYAWLHHIHNNRHHHEYWILDGKPLQIPEKYIKEMVCDWYGTGKSKNGKNDLKEWFRKSQSGLRTLIHEESLKEIKKYVNLLCKKFERGKTVTILGALNWILLQWFFIRLAKLINSKKKIVGWKILFPVLPLTGWWDDYVYLWKKKGG